MERVPLPHLPPEPLTPGSTICPKCQEGPCLGSCEHIVPHSPDLFIKESKDKGKAGLVRFAHLNEVIDRLCCLKSKVDTLVLEGPLLGINDCTDTPLPAINGIVSLPVLLVATPSVTEALTGNGCEAPLSVCIDNVTIVKDGVTGCLTAVPASSSIGYAEYVQHTQAPNNSVAPGTAIMYLTDNPAGVYDTIGITTTTGPGAIGTEFLLPIGTYVIDFENSADAAWSLALYKSVTTQTETIDTNTIAGASTATTWIHGRSILVAAAPTYFIISPVTGTQAIPTAGTAAGEYIARLTILKIA